MYSVGAGDAHLLGLLHRCLGLFLGLGLSVSQNIFNDALATVGVVARCIWFIPPPVLISPSLSSMHSAMIRTPSRKTRTKFSSAVMLSISCCDSISFAKTACLASSSCSVS